MNQRKNLISTVVASLLATDAMAGANSASIASALVHVEAKAWEAEYSEITFQDVLPIIDLNDRLATSFEYYTVESAGRAKFSEADGSIAWVDASMKMVNKPLYKGNTGYTYSFDELERASKLGANLADIKPRTALRASLSLAQETAFQGDASRDIVGLYNNPNTASVAVLDGKSWDDKTPNEILEDLNHLFITAWETTGQVEFKVGSPLNRLVLPSAKWSKIVTTKLSENSDKTILKFFVENSPFINKAEQIIPSAEIAGDEALIYQFDQDKVCFYWGHTLEFKAPQPKDLMLRVPADFSIGGTVVRVQQSIWKLKGI